MYVEVQKIIVLTKTKKVKIIDLKLAIIKKNNLFLCIQIIIRINDLAKYRINY